MTSEAMKWTPDMGEISGFGGAYEEACRKMARTAVAWLRDNPDRRDELFDESMPEEKRYTHYDAMAAAMARVVPGCTGAMVGASSSHALFIGKHGWDAYVEKAREREAERIRTEPERKRREEARRREREAQRRHALQRRDDIVAESEGKGLKAALEVPWVHLAVRPRETQGYRVNVPPGELIPSAFEEAMLFVQVSGETLVLEDVNGAAIVVHPDDTFEQAVERYRQAGGAGMRSRDDH